MRTNNGISSICAITIARLVFYQGILDIKEADFTTTSIKLYIFTSSEPQLAVMVACVPLLGLVSDKLAGFTEIAWMRSLFTTNLGAGKTTDRTADYARYINMSKYEVSCHDAEIGIGVRPNHLRWPLQAPGDTSRIYATHDFDLQDSDTGPGRFQPENNNVRWDQAHSQLGLVYSNVVFYPCYLLVLLAEHALDISHHGFAGHW
jgi:hypothetical protein